MNNFLKPKTYNLKLKRGFTLIEILIVMAILAMLAAVLIVAINPVRQFAQARNTQRHAAVNSILSAVHQNMIDNRGVFNFAGCPATSLPAAASIIRTPAEIGGVDLCGCLVPIYLSALPFDPRTGNFTSCAVYGTGYTIFQDAVTGRITVAAPAAELGVLISITR